MIQPKQSFSTSISTSERGEIITEMTKFRITNTSITSDVMHSIFHYLCYIYENYSATDCNNDECGKVFKLLRSLQKISFESDIDSVDASFLCKVKLLNSFMSNFKKIFFFFFFSSQTTLFRSKPQTTASNFFFFFFFLRFTKTWTILT